MGPEVEAAVRRRKGSERLGAAVYRSTICAELDKQTPVAAYFCIAYRRRHGAAEEEWRKDVSKRLRDIKSNLDTISGKVDVVNQA